MNDGENSSKNMNSSYFSKHFDADDQQKIKIYWACTPRILLLFLK